MRELTNHRDGSEANERLKIEAGEPGPSGAPTVYHINFVDARNYLCLAQLEFLSDGEMTNEALLAIVQNRLEGFQKGPFACIQSEEALMSVKHALLCLKVRTAERVARGVAGKQEP